MVVLDTNVIIEIARGNKKVLDSVLSTDRYFYITSITRFEILIGAPKLAELDLINADPKITFALTQAQTKYKSSPKSFRILKSESAVTSF